MELQKLHRRACLQPEGADGKSAFAGLVERLVGHLPNGSREAQKAMFTHCEDLLANLSQQGAAFQEELERQQKEAADAAFCRVASGDQAAKTEEGDSRQAEECKAELQDILSSSADLGPKCAKLFQRALAVEPPPPAENVASGAPGPHAGGVASGRPRPSEPFVDDGGRSGRRT